MVENNNPKEIKLEENEIMRITLRKVKPDANGHDIEIVITKSPEEDEFTSAVADIFVEAMDSEFEDFVPIYDEEDTE